MLKEAKSAKEDLLSILTDERRDEERRARREDEERRARREDERKRKEESERRRKIMDRERELRARREEERREEKRARIRREETRRRHEKRDAELDMIEPHQWKVLSPSEVDVSGSIKASLVTISRFVRLKCLPQISCL